MRTIAIVWGDNDFAKTFKPLLESVMRAITCQGLQYVTQEFVEKIINDGMLWHYWAFQCPVHEALVDLDRMRFYLTRPDILFDEEAEQDILHKDHNGGAWYLEIDTGKVYSY